MAVVLLIVSVLRLPESSTDASGIPAVPASLLGVLQFATALVALFACRSPPACTCSRRQEHRVQQPADDPGLG
ncbi:MAG: hypothetical protein U0Q04_01545 [Microbacterium sp.]